jgi:nucleoside-diphosphate-sugar epimerase
MTTPHTPLRVLMTGGGGFIGSHLSELLLDRGDTVTVVDDFSTGRRGNLSIVRSKPARVARYRVIEGLPPRGRRWRSHGRRASDPHDRDERA